MVQWRYLCKAAYDNIHAGGFVHGPSCGQPDGRSDGSITSLQSGAAVSGPNPAIGRQWDADIDHAVSREESPAAHLRLVVSGLPCARARVARSDQATLGTGQIASGGNS